MPYLTAANVERLKKNPALAKTVGELNLVYSLCDLSIWQANRQYATIDEIARTVVEPECNPKTATLTHDLLQAGVNESDLHVARLMAFLEFYRRIAAVYENIKADANGDIY